MELNLSDIMYQKRPVTLARPKLYVIGCGGTGSLFVRDAMRIVNVYNSMKTSNNVHEKFTEVVLIDGDMVEEKNLLRQNFLPVDIGRPKAQVLAERYGSAFGIPAKFMTDYIEDEKALYDMVMTPPASDSVFIFSMVDNVKTRLMISNFVMGYAFSDDRKNYGKDIIVVDCGNSEYAGQVCISAMQLGGSKFYIPSVAEQQPDLLDRENWDKFASEMSCEDAATSAPQTISANATAANLAMNALYNMLFQGHIHYKKVVFNAQNNTSVTTFLKNDDLNAVPSLSKIAYK